MNSGIQIEEESIEAGHSPYLSKPDAVIQVIEKMAIAAA